MFCINRYMYYYSSNDTTEEFLVSCSHFARTGDGKFFSLFKNKTKWNNRMLRIAAYTLFVSRFLKTMASLRVVLNILENSTRN